MPPTRTMVYVDGFNLYYGCLKDSPYRWLSIKALCEYALSGNHELVGFKYFTAKVQPRPTNPQQAQRQQIYLRALATTPDLSIHYGHFITRQCYRRLVRPPKGGSPNRKVWITEEKGSDVNLASHLLIDAFRARYDVAVVISNDGDLKDPVHFVRHELGAPVGILNPHPYRSWALSPRDLPAGSFYRSIRPNAIRASQFPDELKDAQGAFHKPTSW